MNAPFHPFPMGRRGTFVSHPTATAIAIRHLIHNLPPNTTWRVRIQRPDGSFATSITSSVGNPAFWPSISGRTNPQLFLTQLGTWSVHLVVNGQLLAVAPFDVVASPGEVVNRAPQPIAATMSPAGVVSPLDVLRCSVVSDLVLDDPDYDLVRYRYRWDVDGVVVRDVVAAALSDVLPHSEATRGQTVTCTVTPSDGSLEGPSARARTVVGPAPLARRAGPVEPTPAGY